MDSRRSFFKRAAAIVAGAIVAPNVLDAQPRNIPCPDVIVRDGWRAGEAIDGGRYEWMETYERGEAIPLTTLRSRGYEPGETPRFRQVETIHGFHICEWV